MTRASVGFLASMRAVIIAAIALFAFALVTALNASNARAGECFTVERQVFIAEQAGAIVFTAKWSGVRAIVKMASDFTHETYAGVTRAFAIITREGFTIIGLEVKGCLLPPVIIPPQKPTPAGLQT